MKSSISNIFRKPLEIFIQTESASGVILGICALAAMIWANSQFSTLYFSLLETKLGFMSLQHWINDGLMTVFFFLVGLEIKRELVSGELSSFRKAALPVMAAMGGMVVPALIYSYFNYQSPSMNGWAIPMATDIAFALGILSLFGSRVPLSLKIFLLALAIVDDLGAILVIAFFYTAEIKIWGLAISGATFIYILIARQLRIKSYMHYVMVGLIAWCGFLYSGIHATIAGVILGLLTPQIFTDARNRFSTYSPVDQLIHVLHPWVGFLIMPVFALANGGVNLSGVHLPDIMNSNIFNGVSLGLGIGKPVGIVLFTAIAVFTGIAKLSDDLKWLHILGASITAGIGFTMSIFIANLALPVEDIIYAKVGIIATSLLAALAGYVAFWFAFTKNIVAVTKK